MLEEEEEEKEGGVVVRLNIDWVAKEPERTGRKRKEGGGNRVDWSLCDKSMIGGNGAIGAGGRRSRRQTVRMRLKGGKSLDSNPPQQQQQQQQQQKEGRKSKKKERRKRRCGDDGTGAFSLVAP